MYRRPNRCNDSNWANLDQCYVHPVESNAFKISLQKMLRIMPRRTEQQELALNLHSLIPPPFVLLTWVSTTGCKQSTDVLSPYEQMYKKENHNLLMHKFCFSPLDG